MDIYHEYDCQLLAPAQLAFLHEDETFGGSMLADMTEDHVTYRRRMQRTPRVVDVVLVRDGAALQGRAS